MSKKFNWSQVLVNELAAGIATNNHNSSPSKEAEKSNAIIKTRKLEVKKEIGISYVWKARKQVVVFVDQKEREAEGKTNVGYSRQPHWCTSLTPENESQHSYP